MTKKFSVLPLFAASMLMITGCATPKIDWDSRTGSYNFDTAVTDFGPPDRQAKLSDGSTVAEWLMRRGYTTVSPASYYGRCHGVICGPQFPPMIETRTPDAFLRLTFGPDNKLAAWKKIAR